jgi:hypothetical protein
VTVHSSAQPLGRDGGKRKKEKNGISLSLNDRPGDSVTFAVDRPKLPSDTKLDRPPPARPSMPCTRARREEEEKKKRKGKKKGELIPSARFKFSRWRARPRSILLTLLILFYSSPLPRSRARARACGN